MLATLLLAGSITTSPADPACAQAGNLDTRVAFDIPAQPLDAALAQYFRATGVQILYDSALATSRRSTAVRGRFAPREALRILLSSTGLVVRYSRASAAIIMRPEARGANSPVPLGRVIVRERIQVQRLSPVARLAYYGQLENELRYRLDNDARTNHLNFSIVARIRIEEDGTLSSVRIDRGSGDRRVDRLLIEALSKATVSAPPSTLDQPLLIALKGNRH